MRLSVLALLLALPISGQSTAASQPTAQGSGKTTQSLTELRTMAEQGDSDSQLKLGERYAKGKGVKEDYNEALKWYVKSAEQGNPQAQLYIGYDYAYGWGHPKDLVKAQQWFLKSANQGYAEAQFFLYYWYSTWAPGVPVDQAESTKWCRKAAEQGHALPQDMLASDYGLEGLQGNGDAFIEAYAWYCLSAANGYKSAAKERDILAKNLYPHALVMAKARARELFLAFPPKNPQH